MSEFENYSEYLQYMENNYNEDDQITIENFISYYINKYRGVGHKNCELTYQDELKNDVDGKLHDFAIIGFNFEKKIYDERNLKKLKKSK